MGEVISADIMMDSYTKPALTNTHLQQYLTMGTILDCSQLAGIGHHSRLLSASRDWAPS